MGARNDNNLYQPIFLDGDLLVFVLTQAQGISSAPNNMENLNTEGEVGAVKRLDSVSTASVFEMQTRVPRTGKVSGRRVRLIIKLIVILG